MALPLSFNPFSRSGVKQELPDSSLLQTLRKLAQDNGLFFYESRDIFHNDQRLQVPLMLIDPQRGIYLFEYKTWRYDDLKDARATKASNQAPSEKTLAFDTIHRYIQTRLQIVANYDDMEIFHFVIMPNISQKEYYLLDPSLQALLPLERILFHNSSQEEIQTILNKVIPVKRDILDINTTLSTLFVQMLVIKDDATIALASKEQLEIIYDTSKGISYISCRDGSGKSTTILLKAIFEHLKSPDFTIIILEPTLLASELLKKKLVDIIEYANIQIDFSKIQIETALDTKRSKAEILLIDDLNDFEDIDLLNRNLSSIAKQTFVFESYNKQHHYAHALEKNHIGEASVDTITDDLYLATFLKIAEILRSGARANDIIIVSPDERISHHILEDLSHFVDDTPTLLDKDKGLDLQDTEHILVAKYHSLRGISRDFVLLLNPINIEEKVINFIYSRAKKQIYVIYDK